MDKRNYLTIVTILLACFILFYCTQKEAVAWPSTNDYDDLVSLFQEFREFQKPEITNGVPNYTKSAMEEKRLGLKQYQKRLTAIDPHNWPIAHQVDFVLVWAEMNGMEFYQCVLKPWSRDPVFYLPSQGGAGPVININLPRHHELPLPDNKIDEFRKQLKAIPEIYEQAKQNLTEAAGDLATIAIHYIEDEASRYQELANWLTEFHPDLVPYAYQARDTVKNYGKWLEENKGRMTAPAGIGKENYNWWMQKVHLFPYTWKECLCKSTHEYDRIITFLKLEEHRNRNLLEIEVADTKEEWYRRLDKALNFVLKFLHKEEILTVPDWLDAADYSDPNEPRPPLPETPTIDSRAREREVLPGETHEFIGHLFDELRLERDNRPIRGVKRRFNMDWIRSEGWAVSLEELLMQAGILDNRPQRGREIEYLMNASHCSLSLPDLRMHSNKLNFTEARHYCAELMPRGWSDGDDRMVWYEQQSNLRFPGFHTGCLLGKAQFMNLFRVRAMQLGDDFNLHKFIDSFLESGMIPMSLIKWEMTGYDDEIKKLCPLIK